MAAATSRRGGLETVAAAEEGGQRSGLGFMASLSRRKARARRAAHVGRGSLAVVDTASRAGAQDMHHHFVLEDLPEALRDALADYDVDGDGTVTVGEIAAGAHLLRKSTLKARGAQASTAARIVAAGTRASATVHSRCLEPVPLRSVAAPAFRLL